MSDRTPHLLTDLVVEENSFVHAGANKGAKVILLKSESDIMETKERSQFLIKLAEYLNIGKKKDGDLIIKTEDDAVPDDIVKLQKTVETQGALILKLSAKGAFGDALAVAVDAITKAADAAAVDSVLVKLKGDIDTIKKDNEIEDTALIKSFEDAISGNLTERANARKAELEKAGNKADMGDFRGKLPKGMQKAFDDLEDDDARTAFMGKFSKSDDSDPVAKLLEKTTTENVDLKKRLDLLEGDAEVTKAEEEFADLKGVVKLDEFIPSILKIRKHDKDAAEELIKTTRALSAQVKQGKLFSIVGKNGEHGSDADQALDKAVKVYKSEHPDVTDEVAMTKVLEDPANAGLYTKYLEQEEAG